MKDLRVAVCTANSGIDQSSDYNDIMKAVATRSDCRIIPLTDYFQMQNDDEIGEGVFTFLLDIEKDIDLTGTNIDGIHQNLVSDEFTQGREIGDAQIQLKQGMAVVEKDGSIGTIYTVFSVTEVALCLEGYDKFGDMVERNYKTNIEDIRLPRVE